MRQYLALCCFLTSLFIVACAGVPGTEQNPQDGLPPDASLVDTTQEPTQDNRDAAVPERAQESANEESPQREETPDNTAISDDSPEQTLREDPSEAPSENPSETPVLDQTATEAGPEPSPPESQPEDPCGAQTLCSGQCVDLQTDAQHCGACGQACPTRTNATASCNAGSCQSSCNVGHHDCNGVCASNDDTATCGTSCTPCPVPANATATCNGTQCGSTCNAGHHDCNGTCVSNDDIATCGTSCTPCPVPANATATCNGTQCGFTCKTGFDDCDGDPSNGCEAELATDPKHCGVCKNACAVPANATATCQASQCDFVCKADFENCDGKASTGCEASLKDPKHCGDCKTQCTTTAPYCTPDGQSHKCSLQCGGSTPTNCSGQCVDLQTDAQHCGACGQACPTRTNATASCQGGSCQSSCNAGHHECNGTCVSNESTATCGTSCTPCPVPANATATCNGTQCGFTCKTGYHECNGACVSNDSTATCGTSCAPCSVPANATATCNGSQCGFACNTDYHACNGACVRNDSVATCGTACTPCATPANARATCDGTQCGFTCNTDYHACSGSCVSDKSTATCGASCTPCPVPANATATCNGTQCGFTCNVGHHDCNGTCVSNDSTATCGTSCTPCTAPANATATCNGSQCGFTCNTGYHLCNGACVRNDATATCGTSCTPCPVPANATATCNGTQCGFTCKTGFDDCDGDPSNGCEANLAIDPKHCGACKNACATGVSCVTGSCGSAYGLTSRVPVTTCQFPTKAPNSIIQTGCYADVKTRKPAAGLIEYNVNSGLWVDGTFKRRFLALPGTSTMGYTNSSAWTMPVGAILIKEFLIDTKRNDPSTRFLLETRFVVKRAAGQWDFYTYKWNSTQTDATLSSGESANYNITEPDGSTTIFTHVFPGKNDCTKCHSASAGYVLGPRTVQMNRSFLYSNGVNDNQIRAMNHIGLFGNTVPAPHTQLPTMPDPLDKTAPLANRARSYLEGNCAHCHHVGGVNKPIDLRYQVSFANTNTCDAKPRSGSSGVTDPRIIAPGSPERSTLYLRMSRRSNGSMPPLGTLLVDPDGKQLIYDWIKGIQSCPP